MSFNVTMQDVTWLVFVKTFWTRITSAFFLGRHYYRICHQLNNYGMNSLYVFATVKIYRKHYLSCVTHLCTSETTSHKPLCTDWLYALEKLSLLQEVVMYVIEISKLPYCTTIYVCPWYVLIMMLRTLLILPYLLWPYESKIYDLCRFFFSLCKKYWTSSPCIVSFVDWYIMVNPNHHDGYKLTNV
jgi:hypothetical protein